MNLNGYAGFRQAVLQLTGIDLDCYKGAQMERRLASLMRRVMVNHLEAYAQLLERDPAALQEFKDWLTINVSEFFRNPEKFEELQRAILPQLLAKSGRLRVWSAGCSIGAEPYSVAILLDEIDPKGRHHILATDLDEQILGQARRGEYTERDLKNVSPQRRARYFTGGGDLWTIAPAIRARVHFQRHNLLSDAFPEELDLILCRNVVIYFTEEAKDRLYRRFYKALKPGGVLFVGGTESLLKAREMGFQTTLPFFYRAVKS